MHLNKDNYIKLLLFIPRPDISHPIPPPPIPYHLGDCIGGATVLGGETDIRRGFGGLTVPTLCVPYIPTSMF